MNSNVVLQTGSAYSYRATRTGHTQELIRIFRNTSRDLPNDVKIESINHYMAILKASGYDEKFRREVYNSSLNGYNKQCSDNDSDIKPLYRPWSWNREDRDSQKIEKKSNWYKSGDKYEHKLFIPTTPNGELKIKIEYAIKEINKSTKVKIIEQPGPTILDVMRGMANSRNYIPCPNIEKCLLCKSGKPGQCRRSDILYGFDCNSEECKVKYHGETHRNGYSRGSEHFNDSKIESVEGVEKSVISKHEWEHNDGEPVGVKMKIIKAYRGDPTSRQCAEGVMIRKTPEDLLMNSKSEFVQPCTVKEKFESHTGSWKDKQREKLTNLQKNALHKKLREKFGKKSNKKYNAKDDDCKEDENKKKETKIKNIVESEKRKNEDSETSRLDLSESEKPKMNRVKTPNVLENKAASSNVLLTKEIINNKTIGSQEFLAKQSQKLAFSIPFSNCGGFTEIDSDFKIATLPLVKSTRKYCQNQESDSSKSNLSKNKNNSNLQNKSRKNSTNSKNQSQDIRKFFEKRE